MASATATAVSPITKAPRSRGCAREEPPRLQSWRPSRGPQWSDVRVVKDIYPPAIKLAFQLTDAEGHVLKQGDRNLRDMAFMMALSIDRNDSRRYEKALLDDWLREEFHGLKHK